MKSLEIRIVLAKLGLALVIVLGIATAVYMFNPILTETYEYYISGHHLRGEVYTAKDLAVTTHPTRMFYDRWDASSGYDGDFCYEGDIFKHGIGMYIPSRTIPDGEYGSTQLGFWLGGEYDQVYFHLCTDSNWTGGYSAGDYRVICYLDGTPMIDTGFNDCDFAEEYTLDVSGVNEILIELQETKGSEGTLNVILGEFEVNKLAK